MINDVFDMLVGDFNENHDPATGRFTEGSGGASFKSGDVVSSSKLSGEQKNALLSQLKKETGHDFDLDGADLFDTTTGETIYSIGGAGSEYSFLVDQIKGYYGDSDSSGSASATAKTKVDYANSDKPDAGYRGDDVVKSEAEKVLKEGGGEGLLPGYELDKIDDITVFGPSKYDEDGMQQLIVSYSAKNTETGKVENFEAHPYIKAYETKRLGKNELYGMKVGSKVKMAKTGVELTKTDDPDTPWHASNGNKYSTEYLANYKDGAVNKATDSLDMLVGDFS